MALQYHFTLPPSGPADALVVREMFDDVKAYVDTLAPISGAAPASAEYVTLATDAGLTAERVLTGTTNQIIITDNGAGSTVVLSLPQDIANTSTPSFAGIKLRNSSGNTVTINPKSSFSNYILTMPVDDGTPNQFLQTDGSGVLSWAAVTSGVTDIHGTANQVIVSATTGSVTLSLPQDIATVSSPQFTELLLSGGSSSADLTIKLHDSNTGFYASGLGSLLVVVGNGSGVQVGEWLSSDLSYTSSGPIRSGTFVFKSPNAGAGHPTVTITPQSSFTSYSLVLPADDGTPNQYLTTDGLGNLSWSTASGTGTVNSGTQYQLAYYATTTNAVSGLTLITAGRVLVSDSNGLPIAATPTTTEINYVAGVTSLIQIQLNAKATDSLVVHLAGTESITGSKTFSVQIISSATSNHLKLATASNNAIISVASIATADRTITIPDPGTNANFVLSENSATINGVKTFAGQLIGKGTATNDSPSAGYIGEVLTASKARSSAVTLSNGTTSDILASPLSLTAGDWLVTFAVGFDTGTSASATDINAGLSTTSATLPGASTYGIQDSNGQYQTVVPSAVLTSGDLVLSSQQIYIRLSASTNYYLVAKATFGLGAASAYGSIVARRIR